MNGSFPDFAALVTSRGMVYLLASECYNYISVYHWQNEVLNEIQNIEIRSFLRTLFGTACLSDVTSMQYLQTALNSSSARALASLGNLLRLSASGEELGSPDFALVAAHLSHMA